MLGQRFKQGEQPIRCSISQSMDFVDSIQLSTSVAASVEAEVIGEFPESGDVAFRGLDVSYVQR